MTTLVVGALTAGLISATAGPAHAAPTSLAGAFDNTAISSDADPGAADLDGSGSSLSATDLDNAGWQRGAPVTVNGTTYTLPDVAPGQPDNVVAAGQTLTVTGAGNALGFLVAAVHGPVTGSGTVHYSDGTSTGYTLTAGDWAADDTVSAALTLAHYNTPAGRQTHPASLYAVTVPIAQGRTVASVTLPDTGSAGQALHVFDMKVRSTPQAPGGRSWTGSWATSFGSAPTVPQSPDWRDQTLRMVVHPHLSGGTVRLRFANTFAPAPVRLGHVTVAVQATGANAAATPVSLAFGGNQQVTIPAGGEVSSDPVSLPVTAGQNLLVSIYLPDSVTAAPIHSYALTTSYTTSRLGGDHTADSTAASYPGTFSFWTYLSGIDVATADNPGTIVALGDSQTDGGHSTKDANHRWPDYYAGILGSQTPTPGIVNAGISGNRLLLDRADQAGTSGLGRLDRDVFDQPNARTLVLYEGINDIALDSATANAVEDGIRRVAAQAHARGLRVIAATIPAFGGYPSYTDARENVRQQVNTYIRSTGDIDSYADFDLATRDPDMPSRLRDGCYDPADHLHFNDTGTKMLADTLAAGTNGTPVKMSQTAVGDFNGDGTADIIARDDTTGTLKMWLGNGDGTFAPPIDVTSGWRPFSQTVAADFTGDGKADIIARDADGNLKLWPGRGDGTFGAPRTVTSGWNFTQTAAGDFDGDGKTDLIARDSSGNLYIWAGHGDGTFGAPKLLTSGWNYTQTAAADFNGDGQADIIARDDSGNLKMWTHNKAGYFNAPVTVTGGWNFTQTAVGDFTKDGAADIIARDDTTGTLKMWTGHGDTTLSAAHNITTGW